MTRITAAEERRILAALMAEAPQEAPRLRERHGDARKPRAPRDGAPTPQRPAEAAIEAPPLIVTVAGLPPSVNHLYVTRRGGGRTLSREACDWYDHAIPIIKAGAQGWAVPAGPLRLTVVLYAMSRARDLDNAMKACQDALARALDFDDKQIYYLAVARGAGKPQRTVYTLEAL